MQLTPHRGERGRAERGEGLMSIAEQEMSSGGHLKTNKWCEVDLTSTLTLVGDTSCTLFLPM